MMENKRNNIVSIDGGGFKGIYSLIILQKLYDKYKFPNHDKVDLYAGTSIGGVIACSLALGMDLNKILSHFLSVDISKVNHQSLFADFKQFLQELFGDVLFGSISSKVFLPVFDWDNKKATWFGLQSVEVADEVPIIDILMAVCSDMRISTPFFIPAMKRFFVDGGIFAYDPVAYWVRQQPISLLNNTNIISIGSGVIENLTKDLDRGDAHDTIYDSFLKEQFNCTRDTMAKLGTLIPMKYTRISEFINGEEEVLSYNEIILRAKKRGDDFDKSILSGFI